MTWRSAGEKGLLVLLTAVSVSCAARRTTVSEVTERLGSLLSPGDPKSRIEEVLTAESVGSGYDRYHNRYSGIVCGTERTVWLGVFPYEGEIHVYVELDDEGCFSKLTVEEILSGL